MELSSRSRRAASGFVLAALSLVLGLGLAACSKSPEEVKAAQAKVEAETTGRLILKSNRPNTLFEVQRVAAAGEAAEAARKGNEEGSAEQAFPRLTPGTYTVTARAEGWPDFKGEAKLAAGQELVVPVNFKSGSLKLETDPAGAIVKLGKLQLGKTPLTVPQLPVGECNLSLEYPAWPAVAHRVTIVENQEAAATVRLPHGRLVVDSVPAGAIVVLDGKAYKQTPLFFDPVAAGPKKLTLQAKDFPSLEVTVTVVDGQEVKISPALGSAFPLIDPAELLRAVWIPDDPNRITAPLNSSTGIYRPKNDVVKNLHRERLYNHWLRKSYRFTGPVKAYDEATGRLEFAEQKSELARYRVLAQLKPGTKSPLPIPTGKAAKDKEPVVLSAYGRLSAVEEPAWPARVITLELADADFLPEEQK